MKYFIDTKQIYHQIIFFLFLCIIHETLGIIPKLFKGAIMKLILGIVSTIIISMSTLGSDSAPQRIPCRWSKSSCWSFKEVEGGINNGNVERMLAQMTPDATVNG